MGSRIWWILNKRKEANVDGRRWKGQVWLNVPPIPRMGKKC